MPDDPMQETGRGLPLATAVLDDLGYRRAAGVNQWTMLRRRG
jgi:serine/threonine-protein kinase RsbW